MLEIKNITKVYSPKGGVTVRALDDVSVVFPEKGMVFLLGKSGSGKSTLLNVIGGLDKPDSGEIIVKGRSSKDFSGSDFDSYRNTCVGFVFQEYNLLNEFSVEQNVALALQLQNKRNDKAAVNELLERVDLKDFGKRKPNTLSGGQKQRVAIARALIKDPEIIMADEPTGALDSSTGKQILDTFKKLSQDKLVIIVSHDREFAERYADRIIEMSDGKIITDVSKTRSEPVKISDNVKLVSNDVIAVTNAENVTESDVKTILDVIKRNGGKAIITAGEDKIENVKRACKINADGSEDTFKTSGKIETETYDGKNTKFIKSRLPASHAFKIGASGLKTKPIRLVFTVFLSVIAFSLFGVLSAFMTYDRTYSISKALQKTNNPAAAVYTKYSSVTNRICVNTEDGSETVDSERPIRSDTYVSKEEIERMNDNSLGVKYAGIFGVEKYQTTYPIGIAAESDYYPTSEFCGFSDCGEKFLKECGYILLEGRYPEAVDEIAVSEYVDDYFRAAQKGSALNNTVKIKTFVYNETGETIYKQVEIDLKITGIYRCGKIDGKFDALKGKDDSMTRSERSDLISAFKDYLNNSFHLVAFVSPDFYETYSQKKDTSYNFHSGMNIVGVEFNYKPIETSTNEFRSVPAFTPKYVSHYADNYVFYDIDKNEIKNFDASGLKLDKNEIYAPLPSEDYGFYPGEPETRDETVRYFKNNLGQTGKLTVKGFYALKNERIYDPHQLIVSDEFIKEYCAEKEYVFFVDTTAYKPDGELKYVFAMAKTDNSHEQTSYILKGEPERDVSRSIASEAYEGILLLVSLIDALSGVFLIVGLILGCLAALLLLNFISASIAAKKRDIGILRAVGARGSDVFKIFFSEALIFALICFVLSTICSGILCGLINDSITSTTVVPTAELLDYNLVNVLFNLVISLFVSALATFLPVLNAAKKEPVESIRSL